MTYMKLAFQRLLALALLSTFFITTLAQIRPAQTFDIIIRSGMVYDGTGRAPIKADVGIKGDRIAAIGNLSRASAPTIVDASGLAVAPGFINMLAHSETSLIVDPRSLSEIKQGVTTQIFGEGSMGPLNSDMKRRMRESQGDVKYDIEWTTLAEYLTYIEKRGISQNVASFIGAPTIREYVIGLDDKPPTPAQLDQMRELVRREMEAGALGITTALIYPPAFFAKTEELIELCKVAAKYQGKYTAHMRSEGNQLIEAVEETIRISREAGLPVEIYHLKASGEANWPKMDQVIRMIDDARRKGLKITADMYTYPAGGTGLDASMPPWVFDGGREAAYKRLQDPATRKKIADAVRTPTDEWENLYLLAGSPDRILLASFRSEKLKPLIGKTLAEVAKMRNKDPVETIMDLVLEDRSRVGTIYFLMSEDNIKKQIRQPWVSFGSDAASIAPEGVFLRSSAHPRAYGNFARLLGKYVREEKVISLAEAIRRLSGLPATNLGLDHRGFLKPGMFADVVVFDPQTIADLATFEKPHQLAVGVRHVFVNGVQVLKDGEHTNAKPGRALWGPGKVTTQTTAAGARPLPPPERWRGLIGEYGPDDNILIVLEKDGRLFALFKRTELEPLQEVSKDVFKFAGNGSHAGKQLVFTRDKNGSASQVKLDASAIKRRQIGPEEGAVQLHIAPVRPVSELMKEAMAAEPPKEIRDFRQPELVELTKLDPTIKLDIRYATTNNFLGTVFYSEPRAFMQRPAAEALVRAHHKLKEQGYGLLIHDAYRPWYVTKVFWDATPDDKKVFVADPAKGSRHNRGCAVDLTLYDLKTGKPVEMVSTYDETSDRAYPNYPGGTSLQRWYRELLRKTMESEGFTVYEAEWWHFDYKDWQKYPILNLRFESL
ncbi:MAG TPA: M15 family metallopeptidase [Pyrinomonadaceae bacterium]|nr:M15 family metallopeptidase [Pyrinomonadaceae bacterium]